MDDSTHVLTQQTQDDISRSLDNIPKNMRLLVLGLPHTGARTRVETQLRISLVLVHASPDTPMSSLVSPEGTLTSDAGSFAARVGSWPYLKLPKLTALKRRHKRLHRSGVPPQNCLSVDATVVRASDPAAGEVFMCSACSIREEKREQRKLRAQTKTELSSSSDNEDGEISNPSVRKVVVFNCGQYLEFEEGRVEFPMRLTCYCRHHKENLGFSVIFTLRDCFGNVVATGETPPIITTDDHKNRHLSVDTTIASLGAKLLKSQSNVSNNLDLALVDAKLAKLPTSPANLPLPHSPATSGISTPASTRFSLGYEKNPRVSSADHVARTSRSSKTSKSKAKPYDAEKRPRKSSSRFSASASFSMTPLEDVKPILPDTSFQASLSMSSPSPSPPASLPYASLSVQPPPLDPLSQSTGACIEPSSTTALDPHNWTINNSVSAPFSTAPWDFDINSSLFSDTNGAHENNTENSRRGSSGSLSLTPLSPCASSESLFSFVNDTPSSDGMSHSPPQHPLSLPSKNLPNLEHPMTGSDIVPDLINNSSNQPPPTIAKVIPSEGPTHGGIEVTILGQNFVPGLVITFGEMAASNTKHWSSSTIICTLPPSSNPGPVVVTFKYPMIDSNSIFTHPDPSTLQFFTYQDNSDRVIMELALQIVGMKMTGKVEDAKEIAVRLIGSGLPSAPVDAPSTSTNPNNISSNAELASTLNTAADSILSKYSPLSVPTIPPPTQAKGFEGTIIRFLSLVDYSLNINAADDNEKAESRYGTEQCISLPNKYGQNLLHLATLVGFHRLVAFLITRGVDVDAKDMNQFTPLHLAAMTGRVSITRQLIDAGASIVGVRNCEGKTALDIARVADQVDIEEMLLSSLPNEDSAVEGDESGERESGSSLEEEEDDSDLESRLSRKSSSHSLTTKLSNLDTDHTITSTASSTAANSTNNLSTSNDVPSTNAGRWQNWRVYQVTNKVVGARLHPSTWKWKSVPGYLTSVMPSSSSSFFSSSAAALQIEDDDASFNSDDNSKSLPYKMRRIGFQDLKAKSLGGGRRIAQYTRGGRKLRTDRMLYLFWLPMLVCALAYAVFCTMPYIRPFVVESTTKIKPPLSWYA